MRKIIIIRSNQQYSDYDDEYRKLVESITNWQEVNEEDFNILSKAIEKENRKNYQIQLSLIELIPGHISKKLVEDYITQAKEEVEKERLQREKYKQSRETRDKNTAEKKKLKLIEDTKKLGLEVIDGSLEKE